MNHDNTKLLFFIRNIDYIEYIFLISEDKYQYTMASYNYTHLTYIVYTINKITQEWRYEAYAVSIIKKITDIIKGSKDIKEYKSVNVVEHKSDVMKHTVKYIRKLKIENILQ